MDGTEDQVAASIVEAFETLKTVQARRAVYHGILDQLHLDEWRDVSIRAKKISFQRDILGSLPLEIVAQIVKYLDLWDILRFQRVSKRWQELLSSTVIYSAALKAYRICPGLAVCKSLFVRCAKRRFALEFGRPYSKAVYPFDRTELREPDLGDRIAYCHRQLAWGEVDEDWRSLGVAVRCLQSGLIRRFVPPNRGNISHVRLSESLLVVITSEGYCTVWEISTERRVSFRLPSIAIEEVTVDRDRVAIITKGKPPSLVVWDLRTGATRSVHIKERPLIAGFHPGADRLIILFLEKNDLSGPSKIVRVRYSFAGKTISPLEEPQVSFALPRCFSREPCLSGFWQYSSEIAGATTGLLIISHLHPNNHIHVSHLLCYYPETDKMSLGSPMDDVKGQDNVPSDADLLMTSDGVTYHMKYVPQSPSHVWIYNPNSPTPFRKSKSIQIEIEDERSDYMLFGDTDVFGIISMTGIQVWSFDPSLDLFDGHRLWKDAPGQE
ncbi:hypothetical protein VTN77DRAFT_8504 [Rasamsonia byssochlamydoides]|uniref:uncharacterized protein n=1 Tax=Rasamsonia byssochlamydoides TaxID=89139 RepID=UPI00374287B5